MIGFRLRIRHNLRKFCGLAQIRVSYGSQRYAFNMERVQRKGLRALHSFITMALLSLTISGCLTSGSGAEDGTDVVADPETVPSPLTPPERTVCDPFNSGISTRDRGLVGHLVYLTDDQPRYTSAHDYIANGTPVQSTLYFDKLFIPTRAWDFGFFTQDGTLLLNQNNQPLYEYFGLRLESQLQLAAGEAPGWYQMAVLSDDGSTVSLKDSEGRLSTLINNDGTHPTRMACAIKSVHLDAGQKLPVVLEYYQGPRYHISMVMMWRPLPDGADPNAVVSDVECGRSGNSRYFDSTKVPSAPSATYYDLLTRGWKPLENDNYFFPEQATNPCAAQNPLLISNFSIDSSTRTSVTVSWVTNQPSTTKAAIKNVATGVTIETTEDPQLTTSHTVTVTGLTANTLYAVRGISSIPSVQTASSFELAFRTPR